MLCVARVGVLITAPSQIVDRMLCLLHCRRRLTALFLCDAVRLSCLSMNLLLNVLHFSRFNRIHQSSNRDYANHTSLCLPKRATNPRLPTPLAVLASRILLLLFTAMRPTRHSNPGCMNYAVCFGPQQPKTRVSRLRD